MLLVYSFQYSQATPFARENTPLRSVKFVRKVHHQQRLQCDDVAYVYGFFEIQYHMEHVVGIPANNANSWMMWHTFTISLKYNTT